ncbi:MAG: porin family protein [Bacteroidia bacterium]|nr:porin family protein [Bacteroidia bacterium]
MSTNELDKLFRDGLQNMENTPNERVWGRIMSNLNARPNPSESKQFLKLIYGGIAILLVAIPLSYWLLNPTRSATNQTLLSPRTSEQANKIAETNKASNSVNAVNSANKTNLESAGNSSNSIEQQSGLFASNQTLNTNSGSPKNNENQGSVSGQTPTNKPRKSKKVKEKKQTEKPARFRFQSIPNRSPLIENPSAETASLATSSALPYGLVTLPDANEYYTLPFRQVGNLEPKTNTNIETRSDKKEIPQNFYKLKGLHFGFIGAVNTVWILNQNTYGQFGKYEMAYKVKLGYYYGAELGYDFSNRFGVQAEYHYRSTQGQDYADKIKRKNIRRSVDLVYQNIPLIFKFKSPRISGEFDRPSSVNVLFGVQYSMLYYAKQKLNNQELIISERFRKNDIGVVFGLEYNAFLSDRLFVSTGIRGTVGLLDMNSKEWENTGTSGSKSSHNATVGFNLGLHYKLF